MGGGGEVAAAGLQAAGLQAAGLQAAGLQLEAEGVDDLPVEAVVEALQLQERPPTPTLPFPCCHVASPHLTSPRLTSPHLAPPSPTSPHLTSPRLTSPSPTSPSLPSPSLPSFSPTLARDRRGWRRRCVLCSTRCRSTCSTLTRTVGACSGSSQRRLARTVSEVVTNQ